MHYEKLGNGVDNMPMIMPTPFLDKLTEECLKIGIDEFRKKYPTITANMYSGIPVLLNKEGYRLSEDEAAVLQGYTSITSIFKNPSTSPVFPIDGYVKPPSIVTPTPVTSKIKSDTSNIVPIAAVAIGTYFLLKG